MLPLKTQRNSTSVKLRLTDCLAPTTHLHTPSSCSVSGDQHNTPCTHSSQLTCRQHVHTEVHMYACVRARTHTPHQSPNPHPSGLIKPTLHVQNALATCTSEDGQREGDFCITTTHNSGRSITRCNHGNPVSTMIVGMMDVECKVEQRANGSRSVFISRTSKKLSNRTGKLTPTTEDHL